MYTTGRGPAPGGSASTRPRAGTTGGGIGPATSGADLRAVLGGGADLVGVGHEHAPLERRVRLPAGDPPEAHAVNVGAVTAPVATDALFGAAAAGDGDALHRVAYDSAAVACARERHDLPLPGPIR